MATRERPGDRAAREARELLDGLRREIRAARVALGMSRAAAARRVGISASQFGRIERGLVANPSVEQVFRAARAVGLRASVRLYPLDELVRDTPQLRLLERLVAALGPGLRVLREVGLPIAGDRRAWDLRIVDSEGHAASVEAESNLTDLQATARRVELKQRDDPDAGVVILLVNRTAHNRRVLADHREALRGQFPLDGAAIMRDLRAGRVPSASGILVR